MSDLIIHAQTTGDPPLEFRLLIDRARNVAIIETRISAPIQGDDRDIAEAVDSLFTVSRTRALEAKQAHIDVQKERGIDITQPRET